MFSKAIIKCLKRVATLPREILMSKNWLLQVHTVGDSLYFFGMTNVNIFLSVNIIVLTSVDKYFFSTCFEWLESCTAVCYTQLWSMAIFSTTISQGSVATHLTCTVATHLTCGGTFNYCFARNLLLSLWVKEF